MRSVIVVETVDRDSIERLVRERLAAGDRRRRGREATRQVWRTAPICAAAGLAGAVTTRWMGMPIVVPLVILLIGTGALILFAYIRRRELPLSDLAAATIDNDARMRGELRSANWFVNRATRDGWADFHLLKAAERLQTIDWLEVYPAFPVRRAQVTTGVLLATAITLAITLPEHVGAPQTAAASAPDVKAPAPAETEPIGLRLDPELQRQLEKLLAAAAKGKLPTADAIASDKELQNLLNKLRQLSDAELLEALKRALSSNMDASAASAENLKKLAEQAKQAAEVGTLPKDLQEALEKLSDEIELARSEDGASDDDASAMAAAASEGQAGEGNPNGEKLSIQFSKAAEAGGGASVMMMSSPDSSAQPGGPPGSGVGGSGSDEMMTSAGTIEAALKKETVEASRDTSGKNVETEIRRTTEHGNATATFTGSASAQFDRTRAAAPPPVPEARRTGVQSYFVRKPQ